MMKRYLAAAALLLSASPAFAFQAQGGCNLDQQHAIKGQVGGQIKNAAQAHVSMRANMLQADLSNAAKAQALPQKDANAYAREVNQIRQSALDQKDGVSPAYLKAYDRELDGITTYVCQNG